jgi:hypothetical protein
MNLKEVIPRLGINYNSIIDSSVKGDISKIVAMYPTPKSVADAGLSVAQIKVVHKLAANCIYDGLIDNDEEMLWAQNLGIFGAVASESLDEHNKYRMKAHFFQHSAQIAMQRAKYGEDELNLCRKVYELTNAALFSSLVLQLSLNSSLSGRDISGK